jgi:tetratricopeptide (TPR) repeat protein
LRVTEAEVAWRCDGLGAVLCRLGDLAGAKAQYERALEIGEAALGPNYPDMAAWRSNLGGVLQDLGDLAGARVEYERALEIGEAALGPDHPHVATWRNNLADVLRALGDLAGARDQVERALAIGEATHGPTIRPWPAGQQPRRRAAGAWGSGGRQDAVGAGGRDQRGGP